MNIPTLVNGWDVCLPDGTKDTTSLHQPKRYTSEVQVHQQLLIKEVAEPLSTFCLKKKLI